MDFVPENCLLGNTLVVEYHRFMKLELTLRISKNKHKKDPYINVYGHYISFPVFNLIIVLDLFSELNYNEQFDNKIYKSTIR